MIKESALKRVLGTPSINIFRGGLPRPRSSEGISCPPPPQTARKIRVAGGRN